MVYTKMLQEKDTVEHAQLDTFVLQELLRFQHHHVVRDITALKAVALNPHALLELTILVLGKLLLQTVLNVTQEVIVIHQI
jgi:hypothetical protein